MIRGFRSCKVESFIRQKKLIQLRPIQRQKALRLIRPLEANLNFNFNIFPFSFSRRTFSSLPIHYPNPNNLFIDPTLPKPFNTILIADRGIPARRIIETCKQLFIKTIALYTDEDLHNSTSSHYHLADQACRVESYEDHDEIIRLALLHNVEAVHAGYNFLSENIHFSNSLKAKNIVFISPIQLSHLSSLSNENKAAINHFCKASIKSLLSQSDHSKSIEPLVQLIPSYTGPDQSHSGLLTAGLSLGVPLVIKPATHLAQSAVGLRVVWEEERLAEELKEASRKAMIRWGDGRLIIEKFIEDAQQIEVIVASDKSGQIVHFNTTDGSIQRNFQKLIQEAPANINQKQNQKITLAAVEIMKKMKGYVGLATIEFLYDSKNDKIYFLEMNHRITPEYAVSEFITQRNFIQLQLHLAKGFALPFQQETINQHFTSSGHAIQVRIAAEHVHNHFYPNAASLIHLREPLKSPSVQMYSTLSQGDSLSLHYDNLISKLLCWAPTRIEAIDKMLHSLEKYQIVGPIVNISFLWRIFSHPVFRNGSVYTNFVQKYKYSIPSAYRNLYDNERSSLILIPRGPEAHPGPSLYTPYILALLYLTRINTISERTSSNKRDLVLSSNNRRREINKDSAWNILNGYRVNSGGKGSSQHMSLFYLSHDEEIGRSAEVKLEATLSYIITNNGQEQDCTNYDIKLHGPNYSDIVNGHYSINNVNMNEVDSSIISACINNSWQCGNVVVYDRKSTKMGEKDIPEISVFWEGHEYVFRRPSGLAKGADKLTGQRGEIVAPMAGKILKVNVAQGNKVEKGKTLFVMEAMKMEHEIKAHSDITITNVLYTKGQFVQGGKPLCSFS